MTVTNSKKAYQSPETTVLNLSLSTHVLAGSDTSTFSVVSNLDGMGGFGGGFNPSMGD